MLPLRWELSPAELWLKRVGTDRWGPLCSHRNPLESTVTPEREVIDAVYCCRAQSSLEAGDGQYRP
jgi:hypothetical protein